MNKGRFCRNYLLALILFNLTACSSMQTVDVDSAMRYSPPPGIDIGSLVEVKTLDDRRLTFRITDIYDQGVDGKYGLVAWEDMEQMKVDVSRQKEGQTMDYILGALGIIAFIALIDSADTVNICSTPPCN